MRRLPGARSRGPTALLPATALLPGYYRGVSAPPPPAPPDRAGLVAVLAGLAAVSAAAIFIRLAEAPALAIAVWRTGIATLVLVPILLVRGEPFLRGRDLARATAAGVALAAHFALWITSLRYTTVAASVVLVCTQPVFVLLLARVFLGERTSGRGLAGIAIALGGVALIVAGASLRGAALGGNALALAGAVAVAVYVLLGRSLRAAGTPILPYAVTVNAVATAVLLPVCLFAQIPLTGYPRNTWLWLLLIALGPQLLGHTLLVWALRHVPAAVVSSSILAEPVVSTALAWLVFAERPGPATVAGGGSRPAVALIG